MKNKIFALSAIIALIAVLVCVVCFTKNKHEITQTGLLRDTDVDSTTSVNITQAKLLFDPDVNSTLNDYQAEQNIPRTLRIISDEENIATTLHYIAPPEIIIPPKALWESIYFEPINKVSEWAKWPPLREVGVPAGSLEVRIWIGFGEGWLQVLRLCCNGGEWVGFYTIEGTSHDEFLRHKDELKIDDDILLLVLDQSPQIWALTPQTNWASLWEKVEVLGILTLPDDSTLPMKPRGVDGVSYVVEVNDGGQYRTYRYKNPQLQKLPETQKMEQIIKTFRAEFIQSIPKDVMSWHY
jgi:hypothetical protein